MSDRGRGYAGRGSRGDSSRGSPRGRGDGGHRGDSGRGRGGGGERGYRGGSERGRGGGRGRGGPPPGPEVYRPADGSQPILDEDVDSLENKLVPYARLKSSLDITKLSLNQALPYRPGYSSKGQKIVLWTNYFRVLAKPDMTLYRYSVDIQPVDTGEGVPREVTGRRLRAQIIKLFLADTPISALAPALASDYQANIVTMKKPNAVQSRSTVAYRHEDADAAEASPKSYTVTLEMSGSFPVADMLDYITSADASAMLANKAEFTQALNIIMNNFPKTRHPRTALSTRSNVHFIVDGPSKESFDLGAGLMAWRGYFTSVRTAATRLLVNVQVKHAAMYKSARLDELIPEFQGNHPDSKKLERFLRSVRVDRLHLKRKNAGTFSAPKTIFGLASPDDGRRLAHPPSVPFHGANAKQVRFFISNSAPKGVPPNDYISVFDFFKKAYGIELKSPLPVVNVGSKATPSYLPAEVCHVLPAQPASAKLTPIQTAQMILFAVRRPFQNAQSIATKGLSDVGFNPVNAALSSFGIDVQPRMLTVNGRILDTPDMRYASGVAKPRFGSWNMGNVKFTKRASINSWSVVWIRSPHSRDPWEENAQKLEATLNGLHKTLCDCGMACSKPHLPGVRAMIDEEKKNPSKYYTGHIKDAFMKVLEKKRNEGLLLVVLPRRDDAIYNAVKYCGDVLFGIHTVCVVADKFARATVQYFANVALKFNLKLGGVNQSLDGSKLGFISEGKTMVVGIDVTHPSPGSADAAPSVAAMVASISKDLGQFPAILFSQTSRQEMVADLNNMLKSRLRLWMKHNHSRLPENILVYRDGVSEGQYAMVVDKELPLLQQACREMYPATFPSPAISIVVAGKRHSTRFYPTSTAKIDERSSNPTNGTVVDRGITEPRYWDFYLQAHTALQGTARPAHYFVVHDEIFRRQKLPSGFSHAGEVLEDITHNMSYMFGRATKAVSYCPPAYYADMACERARCYLSDLFSPDPSQDGSTVGGSEASVNRSVGVHRNIADSMFYI